MYKIVEVDENYECGLRWQKDDPKKRFIIQTPLKFWIFKYWVDVKDPEFPRFALIFDNKEKAQNYIDAILLKKTS
jgi:hypothetical protein